MPGTVERLEYDPNRTAFIALVKYEDGEQAYILAPQRLAAGDKVIAGEKADVKPGNAMPLGQMPVGTIVPQRRDEAGQGRPDRPFGRHLRQLVGRDRGMVILSASTRASSAGPRDCMGTVGAVSNPDNANTRSRQGRPQPLARQASAHRGVAKNPVDHPHGGGEGRTSGGRHPVTPWGKPTKGARPATTSDRQVHHPSRHAKKKR
jgi:large subunit ribosomal protein L2